MPARQSLSDAQRRDWLRLMRSENVGPATFRTLINRFGGAADALDALPELSRRGGLKRPIRIPDQVEVDAELEHAARIGARYVAYGETGYPPRLAQIDASPPLIAILGDPQVAARPMIAIVGARNASAGGRRIARELATALGEAGLGIASGLARGIDGAAHEAALATGTLAVLAGGLDRIYPPQHEDLARQIAESGLLVSEMPIDLSPRGRDFPRRNRIISGVSLGVVIIEAASRSGSLITARFALEQNREIFAVPGSPLDPRCEGTNRLIRQGAVLTTQANDVLEVIEPIVGGGARSPEEASEAEPQDWEIDTPPHDVAERLVGLLSPSPTDVDTLIREAGAPAAQVLGAILELELAGRLQRHAGNRFSQLVG